MALNKKQRSQMRLAMRDNKTGDEVSDAIDAMGSGPADNVTALGSTANLSTLGTQGGGLALSTTDTYSDSAVNTAVNARLALKADKTAVGTLITETEARLDAIEAKVDLIIAKLIAASLMASS